MLPVSAREDVNLSQLRRTIFEMLKMIRIYSKKPGKKADTEVPYILKRGTQVLEAAGVVHKDFAQRLRYARLWRDGRIEGQMVGRETGSGGRRHPRVARLETSGGRHAFAPPRTLCLTL